MAQTNPQKDFTCRYCGKILNSQTELQQHERQQHSEAKETAGAGTTRGPRNPQRGQSA